MELIDARNLAEELMDAHLDTSTWYFRFDRALKRVGQTKFGTPSYISLSYHYVLLNDEDLIGQTMLHEIAHALAGLDHDHDAYWRSIARSLGYKFGRCIPAPNSPSTRYTGTCPGGHGPFHRQRIDRKLLWRGGSYICPSCPSDNNRITYLDNGVKVA